MDVPLKVDEEIVATEVGLALRIILDELSPVALVRITKERNVDKVYVRYLNTDNEFVDTPVDNTLFQK